jgi:uncharacterized membrane protein YgcG
MRRRLHVPIVLELLLLGAGTLVWAQEEISSLPPPPEQPQTQEATKQVWSPQELNNLVASIALYPDPLLGQMLVASTYPLEVVEAEQWLQRNKNLTGRELMDAAKRQPWDPSVQALVAVPDALAELNRDIRWTTELGNAFLAQQADVMNAVQQMRARAQANGRLYSTQQQTVSTEEQGGQQAIVIQPANPQIIYVPYYDPFYIWGPPVYGYYPPAFYSGWGFGFGPGFNLSFCFDGWGGWGFWGWGPNWFGRTIFVNNFFFPRYGFHFGYRHGYGGRAIWVHDPGHRLGIPYSNRQVAARFERASIASRNSFRAGAGRSVVAAPYTNRSAGRFSGRTMEQGYRNTAPQQRYQSLQQYRNAVPQQTYRLQQQYRSAPQQYRAAPRISVPRVSHSGNFGGGGSFSGRHSSGGGGSHGSGGGGGRHR